tara:strand:- start:79 stop:735 length:657 start_codon:yes stop_codon:yes gene_type:complete
MVELIDTGQDAIASYPYDSLEEGFGEVSYYHSAYEDNTGKEYLIAKPISYSSDIQVSYYNLNGNDTKTFYTGTFARPRTIKGNINITFCTRMLGQTAHSPVGSVYYQIKIYHYDGSTSTQIGSTWQSQTVTTSSDWVAKTEAINAIIPITTSKKFRTGDQIKIEVITYGVVVNNGRIVYGIDPQNRDGDDHADIDLKPSERSSDFTQFIVRIPYKLVN